MENHSRISRRAYLTFFLVACTAALSVLALQYVSKKTIAKKELNESKKGFAVVELFTSQGCASCPPAHKLLAKIEKGNPTKNIYALAYHVDFWDHKHWRDTFGNAEFSRRQLNYAKWLNVPNVYAPQIVVNGQSEFHGTQENKIKNLIDELLERPSKATLFIQAAQDDDKLLMNYQVKDASPSSNLEIVIVKKTSEGEVLEGEQRGHRFMHVQTVRGFHSKSLTKEGKGTTIIDLPEGFNTTDWEVVAMIQEPNNKGEIVAARKVVL